MVRANITLTEYFLRDAPSEEALPILEEAVRVAERALISGCPQLATDLADGIAIEDALREYCESGVENLYWYAAALSMFAVEKDVRAVVLYQQRILAAFDRVIEIAPSLYSAGPHRRLADFLVRAPAYAGGNPMTAREHYQQAIELASTYLPSKLFYAEHYAASAGEEALFEKLLEEVLAADIGKSSPEILPEQELAQARARLLQRRQQTLF
jgi:hypothetical protein